MKTVGGFFLVLAAMDAAHHSILSVTGYNIDTSLPVTVAVYFIVGMCGWVALAR